MPIDEVEKSNLAKALFALERSFTIQEVTNIVATLGPFFRSPRNRSLMRAFSVWLNKALLPAHNLEIPADKLEDFGEVQNMLQERVKQWVKQWKAEGLAEGQRETRREIALAMIKQGLDFAIISQTTGLAPSEVDALAEEAAQGKTTNAKPVSDKKVSETARPYKTAGRRHAGRQAAGQPAKPGTPPKANRRPAK